MANVDGDKANIYKIGKQRYDVSKMRGGVKSDNMSEKSKIIFEALDGNLKPLSGDKPVGAKDNVLDKEELSHILAFLSKEAGRNQKLGKKEFKKLIEDYGLADKGVTVEDLAEFFGTILTSSELVEESEVQEDEDGNRVVITRDREGNVETRNSDGSYNIASNTDDSTTTKYYATDGKLEKDVTTDGERTVTTEYTAEGTKKRTVNQGTTEEVFDVITTEDGQETQQIKRHIENKGLDAKEKITDFEYDENGNVIAKNVTANDVTYGKIYNRYVLDPESGKLLPEKEILNQGTENEIVTEFENIAGVQMHSTTTTPNGIIRSSYDIKDETDEDGVAVLQKRQEILTKEDGYEMIEYNEDSTIYTSTSQESTRVEKQEKNGKNTIKVDNENGSVVQTIEANGSKEVVTRNKKQNTVTIERFKPNEQQPSFVQVTDNNKHTTEQTVRDGNNTTVTQWDKDDNVIQAKFDKNGKVVSQKQMLGKKAQAEMRRQNTLNTYMQYGLDPNSVSKYNSKNNKITVKLNPPKGKETPNAELKYEDPVTGKIKVYKYTAYENYTAKAKWNAQGEVIGVTYSPKHIKAQGKIVGDVKGSPNTVLVECQGKIYYVDKRDGIPRTPKRVRGEMAFNDPSKQHVKANIVYGSNNSIQMEAGDEDLIVYKDAKGKPILTDNGEQIAIDKFGNQYIIPKKGNLSAKDLVEQYTIHQNGKNLKLKLDNNGNPVTHSYAMHTSWVAVDKDGKEYYVSPEEGRLALQSQRTQDSLNPQNQMAILVEGENGLKAYARYTQAEKISGDFANARLFVKDALVGLEAELDYAEENLEKYLNGDGKAWDHATVDWLGDFFGSNNSESVVKENLANLKKGIQSLKNDHLSDEQFKAKYKEVFGKDLDQKELARFFANQNESSRRAAMGDSNANTTVNDYINSQYSAAGNLKSGGIIAASIGAALTGQGELLPVLTAAGTSIAFDVSHNLTTGADVDWSLVKTNDDGNLEIGGLGKILLNGAEEAAFFYAAGKVYRAIEGVVAKPLADQFLMDTGFKVLQETNVKIAELGIKDAEKELARLTAKQASKEALSEAESNAFKLLTERAAIMQACEKPTTATLGNLVKLGIVTDETLAKSFSKIPVKMLPRTVAFDTGLGATMEYAQTGEITPEGVAKYAGMSLLFQTVPGMISRARTGRGGKRPEPRVDNEPNGSINNDKLTIATNHQPEAGAPIEPAQPGTVKVGTEKAQNITAHVNENAPTATGRELAEMERRVQALGDRELRRTNQRTIDDAKANLSPEERGAYEHARAEYNSNDVNHIFTRGNGLKEKDLPVIEKHIAQTNDVSGLNELQQRLTNMQYNKGGETQHFNRLQKAIDQRMQKLLNGIDDVNILKEQRTAIQNQHAAIDVQYPKFESEHGTIDPNIYRSGNEKVIAAFDRRIEVLERQQSKTKYEQDVNNMLNKKQAENKGLNSDEVKMVEEYLPMVETEAELAALQNKVNGRKMTTTDKKSINEAFTKRKAEIKAKAEAKAAEAERLRQEKVDHSRVDIYEHNGGYTTEHTIDKNGVEVKITHKDPQGRTTQVEEFTYDARGNRSKSNTIDVYYNKDGSYTEHTRNANGVETKIVYKDKNGNVTKVEEYNVDKFGNRTLKDEPEVKAEEAERLRQEQEAQKIQGQQKAEAEAKAAEAERLRQEQEAQKIQEQQKAEAEAKAKAEAEKRIAEEYKGKTNKALEKEVDAAIQKRLDEAKQTDTIPADFSALEKELANRNMIDELVRLAEVDSSMGSHKDSLVRNIYTKVKEARTNLSKIAGLKPEKVLDTIAGSNEGLMPQFSNNVFYGYGEMNITGKFGEIYTLKYKDGKMVTIRVKISGDSRLLYKVEANGKTTKIDSKEYIELNKGTERENGFKGVQQSQSSDKSREIRMDNEAPVYEEPRSKWKRSIGRTKSTDTLDEYMLNEKEVPFGHNSTVSEAGNGIYKASGKKNTTYLVYKEGKLVGAKVEGKKGTEYYTCEGNRRIKISKDVYERMEAEALSLRESNNPASEGIIIIGGGSHIFGKWENPKPYTAKETDVPKISESEVGVHAANGGYETSHSLGVPDNRYIAGQLPPEDKVFVHYDSDANVTCISFKTADRTQTGVNNIYVKGKVAEDAAAGLIKHLLKQKTLTTGGIYGGYNVAKTPDGKLNFSAVQKETARYFNEKLYNKPVDAVPKPVSEGRAVEVELEPAPAGKPEGSTSEWQLDPVLVKRSGLDRNKNARTNVQNLNASDVTIEGTFNGYYKIAGETKIPNGAGDDLRSPLIYGPLKNSDTAVVYDAKRDITMIVTNMKDAQGRAGTFNIQLKGQVSESDAAGLISHLKNKKLIPENMRGRKEYTTAEARRVQQETARYFNEILPNKPMDAILEPTPAGKSMDVVLEPAPANRPIEVVLEPEPVIKNFEGRPLDQANDFAFSHKVGVGERVVDGYKDGGRARTFDANGRINNPGREIIVVDRKNDIKLQAIIRDFKQKAQQCKTPQEKADLLQKYIYELAGDGTAACKESNHWLESHTGTEAKLGDIFFNNPPIAVCRHRSLLFKILGDEVGLSVELQRGGFYASNGGGGGHAWNVVKFENGTSYIYDAMHNKSSNITPGHVDSYAYNYKDVAKNPLYENGYKTQDVQQKAEPQRRTDARNLKLPESEDVILIKNPDGSVSAMNSTEYLNQLQNDANMVVLMEETPVEEPLQILEENHGLPEEDPALNNFGEDPLAPGEEFYNFDDGLNDFGM